MRKLFLILALLFIAVPAISADWVNVGTDGNYTGYLDKNSFIYPKYDPALVQVKIKMIADNISSPYSLPSPSPSSTLFFMKVEVLCYFPRKIRTMSYTFPSGPGGIMEIVQAPAEDLAWKLITPLSNAETIANLSCKI